MRYAFQLTGVTPLLMHADDVDWADELTAWRKDPKNKNQSRAGDDRSPAWTWTGYLYRDGTNVTVPVDNFQRCLSAAGARMILKGKRTFKEAAVSGIWIEQEYLAFTNNGTPVPLAGLDGLRDETDFTEHKATAKGLGFDLMTKRVRVGMSKHIRVRPMFAKWAAAGTLEITSDDIKPANLEQLFDLAGRIGLGDWRPGAGTPGRYGMFTHTLKPAK